VLKALNHRHQQQYDSIDDDDDVNYTEHESDADIDVNDIDSAAKVSYPLHHSSHNLNDASVGSVYPLPSCLDAYQKLIVILLMLFISMMMGQMLVIESIRV